MNTAGGLEVQPFEAPEAEGMLKDDFCFVCGPENARGLQATFAVDPETRSTICRLAIPAHCQGWHRVAHGGIVATLLDEACAHAARTVGPQPVTAELTVKYHRPVPVDTEIVVRGEITGGRKRLLEVQAALEVAGVLHAEAKARIFLLRPGSGGPPGDGTCP